MNRLDYQTEQHRQDKAGAVADGIVARLKLRPPIDPMAIIDSERPFIRAGGRDFGAKFDGKLKFVPEQGLFLLMFNTKYDTAPGKHHPRTRFSICHELGHYFLEEHHRHLRHAGPEHGSRSEAWPAEPREREADAFAAHMLLPTELVRPFVNQRELTLTRLEQLADQCGTSMMCTAIRAVRLSDDPCAVVSIQEGRVAWRFHSECLVNAGCYPGPRTLESRWARERWAAFSDGNDERFQHDGMARSWFEMYGRADELHDLLVTEHFLPVRINNSLLVLIALDYDDLHTVNDDEGECDD